MSMPDRVETRVLVRASVSGADGSGGAGRAQGPGPHAEGHRRRQAQVDDEAGREQGRGHVEPEPGDDDDRVDRGEQHDRQRDAPEQEAAVADRGGEGQGGGGAGGHDHHQQQRPPAALLQGHRDDELPQHQGGERAEQRAVDDEPGDGQRGPRQRRGHGEGDEQERGDGGGEQVPGRGEHAGAGQGLQPVEGLAEAVAQHRDPEEDQAQAPARVGGAAGPQQARARGHAAGGDDEAGEHAGAGAERQQEHRRRGQQADDDRDRREHPQQPAGWPPGGRGRRAGPRAPLRGGTSASGPPVLYRPPRARPEPARDDRAEDRSRPGAGG